LARSLFLRLKNSIYSAASSAVENSFLAGILFYNNRYYFKSFISIVFFYSSKDILNLFGIA
jgi:hypothetical protein